MSLFFLVVHKIWLFGVSISSQHKKNRTQNLSCVFPPILVPFFLHCEGELVNMKHASEIVDLTFSKKKFNIRFNSKVFTLTRNYSNKIILLFVHTQFKSKDHKKVQNFLCGYAHNDCQLRLQRLLLVQGFWQIIAPVNTYPQL